MPETTPTSKLRPSDLIPYWPRLTRFYGLSPHELQHYPTWLLERYLEELPKLSAEEQIMRMVAADMPHLERADRARAFRILNRAMGDEPAQRVDVGSEEGKRTIQGMGIGVRMPRA